MFSRILIANRGEVACRVIRTARAMGIETVAVYSDADREAPHVAMADEAVRIGPAPAAASYLSIEALVAAARDTRAEAVHPGYGFLSENARFVRALDETGIVFIGPGAAAIEMMGDKIAARRLAAEAGVATVPGSESAVATAGEAADAAKRIGYPVMLKAAGGGGGRGLRAARDDAGLREAFHLAASEAQAAFGDGRMFVEALIAGPRHIEVQILADRHGNVIHLGERECSIQRRNQKVVEEAPSSFVDEAMRREMGEQAVAIARAVAYESAGTVEFLVSPDRRFHFIEMNTRLQVEHPVTEMVTGIDIVAEMIRVAADVPLSLVQDDVGFDGWAIEARVCAEDPCRDFLPSTGRLVRYRPPAEGRADGASIRVDSGVEEGSVVPVHYDAMIAKLCVHGPDRALATRCMQDALDRFAISGIEHNLAFLAAVMASPRWAEGRLSTAFIAEEFPGGFAEAEPSAEVCEVLVVAAAAIDRIAHRRSAGRVRGAPRKRAVDLGGALHQVTVADDGERIAVSAVSGRLEVQTAWRPGESLFEATLGGREVAVLVEPVPGGHRLSHRGARLVARVHSPREAELMALMPLRAAADTSRHLLCPMPGIVVSIDVAVGQRVKPGEPLCVVEAMKMENVLKVEREVTVAAIRVAPGDSLAANAVIMDFE